MTSTADRKRAGSEQKTRASQPRQVPAQQHTKYWGFQLSSFENFESLDHPHIRELCKIDREVRSRCIMCESAADPAFTCKSCKGAKYCSWECSIDDDCHARVCAQWPKFASGRPGKAFGRVLIFPAKSTAPVFAWAEVRTMRRLGEEESQTVLGLWDSHNELGPLLFNPELVHTRPIRMSCINVCRALAGRRPAAPLGHGLFLFEWCVTANLEVDWINRSVASLAPKPGRIWHWTGPVIVFSLDLSRTKPKANTFALDDVDLRDVRHAVDFFRLNMRNPCLTLTTNPTITVTGPPSPPPETKPLSLFTRILMLGPRLPDNWDPDAAAALATPPKKPTTKKHKKTGGPPAAPRPRFPFPTLPAVKLNETTSPVARALGIADPLEEVLVSRHLPRASQPYQGVPVLCSALRLAWAVRVALGHGEELDWLYEGYYYDHVPGGDTDDTTSNNSKSAIPRALDVIHALDEHTRVLQTRRLPRSGDGLVFVHARGGKLCKEHVQALLQYVDDEVRREGEGGAEGGFELSAAGFRAFWTRFSAEQKLPEDMPSPYELPLAPTPQHGGKKKKKVDSEETFLVCKDIFEKLVMDKGAQLV